MRVLRLGELKGFVHFIDVYELIRRGYTRRWPPLTFLQFAPFSLEIDNVPLQVKMVSYAPQELWRL